MSQAEREAKLRSAVAGLRHIAKERQLYIVEQRRLRELERDLAKIDARKARAAE